MNTTDFNQFSNKAFNEAYIKPDSTEKSFKPLAAQLEIDTKNLPEGARTPTAQELSDMNNFIRAYKRQSPNASKREIRRATQKQFGLLLLPKSIK